MDQPTNISFALQADGLAIDPINTSITPIIIFSSFENEYKMQSVLCSNPFMAFAMAGTFLASDGLYTTSSGNFH
jgi:NADH-quinone oxidoreductase subunit M